MSPTEIRHYHTVTQQFSVQKFQFPTRGKRLWKPVQWNCESSSRFQTLSTCKYRQSTLLDSLGTNYRHSTFRNDYFSQEHPISGHCDGDLKIRAKYQAVRSCKKLQVFESNSILHGVHGRLLLDVASSKRGAPDTSDRDGGGGSNGFRGEEIA